MVSMMMFGGGVDEKKEIIERNGQYRYHILKAMT